MLRKWDIILIIFLITISFIPELVFGVMLDKTYERTYAEVTLNGKLYKKIPLSEHIGEEELNIKTDFGYNSIKINDNSIEILDADCPDKICIKSGSISKPGEKLVCLPHKLMIEILGSDNKNNMDIIPTH